MTMNNLKANDNELVGGGPAAAPAQTAGQPGNGNSEEEGCEAD